MKSFISTAFAFTLSANAANQEATVTVFPNTPVGLGVTATEGWQPNTNLDAAGNRVANAIVNLADTYDDFSFDPESFIAGDGTILEAAMNFAAGGKWAFEDVSRELITEFKTDGTVKHGPLGLVCDDGHECRLEIIEETETKLIEEWTQVVLDIVNIVNTAKLSTIKTIEAAYVEAQECSDGCMNVCEQQVVVIHNAIIEQSALTIKINELYSNYTTYSETIDMIVEICPDQYTIISSNVDWINSTTIIDQSLQEVLWEEAQTETTERSEQFFLIVPEQTYYVDGFQYYQGQAVYDVDGELYYDSYAVDLNAYELYEQSNNYQFDIPILVINETTTSLVTSSEDVFPSGSDHDNAPIEDDETDSDFETLETPETYETFGTPETYETLGTFESLDTLDFE